jgi:hypothetical protein
LNHPVAKRFIDSIVFWDAKRPITKALLQRLDFAVLIRSFSDVELFDIVSQWRPHFENSNLPNVVDDLHTLLDTLDWLT